MTTGLVLETALAGLLLALLLLVTDDNQRHDKTETARGQCDKVRRTVAGEAVVAGPLARGLDNGVGVKHKTVKQVEDVAGDNWRQRHEAPVLREAVDTKRLGDNGREDAKQETVAETRETRYKSEKVRVLNVDGAELGADKDGGGDDEAPDAAGVEVLN